MSSQEGLFISDSDFDIGSEYVSDSDTSVNDNSDTGVNSDERQVFFFGLRVRALFHAQKEIEFLNNYEEIVLYTSVHNTKRYVLFIYNF